MSYRICDSCGGVLGRDCFNPQECTFITQRINMEAQQEGESSYADLKAENENLKAFKSYVHDRLDKMGIPSDPEPENNLAHGCRIEGRLNNLEAKNAKLRSVIQKQIHRLNLLHESRLVNTVIEDLECAIKQIP